MVKVGDVFEIETAKGRAYFQYFGKAPVMGALIRVLPGTYDADPELSKLVEEKTNFWVFFPVSASLKQGVIKKKGNFPLPVHSKEMPVFRSGIINQETKRVNTWWFWDGTQEWMVGSITDEQRKMPIKAAWNDTMLIKRIEDGWLPEKDAF